MRALFLLLAIAFVVPPAQAQQTLGLFTRTAAAQDGFVLFAPLTSTSTYLIDKCGKSVHSWSSTHKPGQSVYLLEDGSLLRPGSTNNAVFNAGGSGGIIERFDWNNSVLWSYSISSSTECQHHDVCRLPNGNILAIVWESKTGAETIAAGRNPTQVGTALWSEKIVELQPSGSNAAIIVWEWHVWDHLVQDQDNSKPDYAIISQHPELINLNYNGGMPTNTDWLHINAVTYNPALNQIMLSVHNFSEIWIIDHSTTTAQATTHAGGVRGKGGDLLYRWGNPIAYGRGTVADRMLYSQHNAHWIESGLADSGKIMIFNNGQGRPAGNYSSVDVFAPPVDASGGYALSGTSAYGPSSLYWQYKAGTPSDFYAMNISGAQRLSNGNTLICEGTSGRFFEVDASGNMVWKYVNPIALSGALSQGAAASQNLVFRCTQYTAGYSGLAGKNLTPGAPLEQNPLSYNCAMGNPTGISSPQRNEAMAGIASPFGYELLIHANSDVEAATIVLSSASGGSCRRWNGVRLRYGETLRLSLDVDLPSGVYFLRLSASNVSTTIKLCH